MSRAACSISNESAQLPAPAVDIPSAVSEYSSVLQFKLIVVESSPEIFRRVRVPDFTLESFTTSSRTRSGG